MTSLCCGACSDGDDARRKDEDAGGASNAAGGSSGGASAGGAGTLHSAGSAGVAATVPNDRDDDPATPYFAPEHVLEVALAIDASDWDALRAEKRSVTDIVLGEDCQSEPFPNPFTWKHAKLTIDGASIENVGVRKKGFLGSLDKTRPSLKIATDTFESKRNLFGVKEFTFNNVRQDPSIIGECLGFHVFDAAGLPAPRCNFAHVTVNEQNLGVYVHLEAIKKPFLRRHFQADSGDLYEGTLSDFREGWLGTFDPKTAETDSTRAPLRAIAEALTAVDGDLLERLRKVMDLDAFLRYWAIEVVIAHVDGYSRNTNNYYVYRDPETRLATLIPWGADLLFGNGDSSTTSDDPMGRYTEGAVVHALYATPQGRVLLFDALSSVLKEVWVEEDLLAEVDRMARLVRPLLDPDRQQSFDYARSTIEEFIHSRRSALEAAMTRPPLDPWPFRETACLRPIGSVSGSFATTWGTIGSPDPFASGSGTLDATIHGITWENLSGYVGAVAGTDPDPTAEHDGQLALAAVRTDGMLSVMAFGFDTAALEPGSLALDLEEAPAVLLSMDPKAQGSDEVVGVVVGGTLDFERVSTSNGSPVVGRFSGELYSTPFLNGF
ncbi:MAG: CotH kinase family protein [Polyangiaceae bacterium]